MSESIKGQLSSAFQSSSEHFKRNTNREDARRECLERLPTWALQLSGGDGKSHVLIYKLAHICPGLGIFWKLRAWPRTAGSCRPASRPRGPLRSLHPYKGSASRRPGSDAPRATSEAGGEGRPRDKKTSDAGGEGGGGAERKGGGEGGLNP